ncbi:hypothetical protein XabCFBP2524_12115 [Xanthomonas axonopodis pv. begoniae]|nr:hypothetical protein XabCFBP2524_12115 [Xanthomonas axonopodis pv. begoniae]
MSMPMPFFFRAGLLTCVLFSGTALAEAPDKADKSAAKPDAAPAVTNPQSRLPDHNAPGSLAFTFHPNHW